MFTLQQLIASIVIGLVQGISEWLPISSKTQVLIASEYLLNLTFQQAYTFGLFMEIGTTLAAIVYFRRELWDLVQVILGSKDKTKRKLFVYVLTTTVITGLIAAPLYLVADSITGVAVGIPMLLIGLVLIVDALLIWHSRRKIAEGRAVRKFGDMKFKDYIIIGIAQGIAALPGVSRSGITTSAMLLMKIEPDEAFRLSFLIGIFATLGAFGLTLIASHANVSAALSSLGLTGLLIAIAVSFMFSLFLIDFLINVAGKKRIVYVTAALGVIALAAGIVYLVLGA